MTAEGRVHPDCRNASNPYHECSEFCFKIIAEAKKKQISKAETGILQAKTVDVQPLPVASLRGGEDAPVERHHDENDQADAEGDMIEDAANLTGRKKKLFELRLKMNEARKANQSAMVAEKKKREAPAESRGMSKQKWIDERKKKIGKLLDANGLDMSKAYMLDTQESAESKYKKWEKDPAPAGWDAIARKIIRGSFMGLSTTEVNLKRLLTTAPQQQNQAKLIHYVATLRELLEQLAEEKNPDGLPRVSKPKVSEYAENIEAIAAKIAVPMSDVHTPEEPLAETSSSGTPKAEETVISPKGLRRRLGVHSSNEERSRETVDSDQSTVVKLDDATRTHIDKHRKLQDDLMDEMVVLARQLKESSLMMNQSIKNTEKILDSTENAVEHNLASTGHATSRATEVYSRSFKTTCFQWLVILVMTLVFVMVVLLIRVT